MSILFVAGFEMPDSETQDLEVLKLWIAPLLFIASLAALAFF
jgi:hypothetical protein